MDSKTMHEVCVVILLLATFFLHLDFLFYIPLDTDIAKGPDSDAALTDLLTQLMTERIECSSWSGDHRCFPFYADMPKPAYHVLYLVDNAPLAIVMITNNVDRRAFALSLKNKLAYAKYHGYSLIVTQPHLEDRSPQWSKMGAILNAFSLHQPLVWMLDIDTIITNFSIPIHRLPDAFPNNSRMVYIPRDCNNLNTGSWLLKNTAWTHYFLNQIHHAYGIWKLKEPTWCEQQVLIDFHSMFPSVKERVQELPDWILNLYPPECPDSIPRPWEKGDFVLHFAGLMHGTAHDQLYLRYYEEMEQYINSTKSSELFNESYWFQLIQQFI